MQDIIIDTEFKALIPPLLQEERRQLEENILKDGCLDSLKVWNGVLLDGHNRHEICTAHRLTYKTEVITLNSREDAIIWICKNQTGRRNITDEQRTYLLGKEQEARKKINAHNPTGTNQYTREERYQNGIQPKGRTAQIVADEHGVGYGTVIRAEQFAKGIDVIAEVEPELKQTILSGKANVTKKDVSAVAVMPEPERPAAIERIKRGEKVSEPPIITPREVSPIDLEMITKNIRATFAEFIETIENLLDVHRDLIDSDPQKIISVFSDNIKTLNEMKEGLK